MGTTQLRMRSSRLVLDVEPARSSRNATAMLASPMITIAAAQVRLSTRFTFLNVGVPQYSRDTRSRAYCSVKGMIGIVTKSSRPSVTVTKPLAQSKSQPSMLRLPKNPSG